MNYAENERHHKTQRTALQWDVRYGQLFPESHNQNEEGYSVSYSTEMFILSGDVAQYNGLSVQSELNRV